MNTKQIKELMFAKNDEIIKAESAEKKDEELIQKLEGEYDALKNDLEATQKAEDDAAERARKKAQREKDVADFSGSRPNPDALDGEQKELQSLAKKVNFAKAVATILPEGKGAKLDGVEAEVQQIAEKEKEESGITHMKVYKGGDGNVISIPQSMIRFGNMYPDGKGGHIEGPRNATISVSTEGTDTVQTTIQSIIPALNIDPVLVRAGARTLTGLVGDQQWPLGSTLTMAWEGETDTEADATASFTNTSISPKRLGGKIPVTWKFMKQVPAAQNFFNGQLERHIRIALDAAGFHGATNGPTGIESTTGVTNTHATGASAALTWTKAVQLKAVVKEANGDAQNSAYFFSADVWQQAMTTFRNTGTSADRTIIDENGTMMAGSRYFVTESVTNDATSSSDLAYIFYGEPAQNIFGFWGGIDLLYDPYTSAASGFSIIHSNLYCDHVLLLGGTWSFDGKVLIT